MLAIHPDKMIGEQMVSAHVWLSLKGWYEIALLFSQFATS